ncbi:MAG: hypothetical protein J0L53_03920 [Spirochaetes bacterium]|nr:hypothetical protein [Spirochaetota bacterium]
MNPKSFFFAAKRGYWELRGITALCCILLPDQAVQAAPSGKANLAKVAILPYIDRTGTGNFRYLSTSLTEAVENSLKQKFEFVAADRAAVQKATRRLNKDETGFNPSQASELQAVSQSDILIFGYFRHDAADNRILIYTYVSIANGNYFRSLPRVSNTVDATLFRAVDNVAADILAELASIAQAQQQKPVARGKTQKVGDKMPLTRDAIRSENLRYTWLVGGSIFAFGRLPDQAGQTVSLRPGFTLNAERALWKNFFIDAHVGLLPIKTKIGQAGTVLTLNAWDAMLGFMYHYRLSALWELAAGASAGYFYGSYEKAAACGSGQCISSAGSAANPALAIRSAVHYLLWRNFAIGLEARWTMLVDSPDSLQLFSLGLRGQYLW